MHFHPPGAILQRGQEIRDIFHGPLIGNFHHGLVSLFVKAVQTDGQAVQACLPEALGPALVEESRVQ